ncbi:MAG: metal-dependent hydrolase [Planctomycetes bacterium]|nr:metal-dependent hydrolase [Planctomycetota bacterium]
MIIDANAYLGHWATRQLRHNTPDGLLKLMDRAEIDKACVSSASAILYKNSQSGNEELAEAVEGRRDRLIPLAVINPAYAAWEKDLAWCRDVLKAKGLRLYPSYHRYALKDACCAALIKAATEMGLLVSIPIRQVDYRQRHWLVNAPDVPLPDLAALVAAHPKARFILLEGAGYLGSDLVKKAKDLPANYWIEISRPDAVYGNEIGQILEALGASRLVFGTGIPFKYPEPAVLRMEVLKATAEDKAKICCGNIQALLDGALPPSKA